MTAAHGSNDIVEGEETAGVPGRSGRDGVRDVGPPSRDLLEEVATKDIFTQTHRFSGETVSRSSQDAESHHQATLQRSGI